MPKCSCAGSACSCQVTSGAGITIAGTGSVASPYVVSLSPTPGDIVFSTPGVLDLSTVGAIAVVRVRLQANVSDILLPSTGTKLDVLFQQDATGGRTVNFPDPILFPGGGEPVVTATPNAVDWFTFVQAGGVWAGIRTGANLT